MNTAGLIAQVLPVGFLLSSRCSNWGSLLIRFSYAALYLALPNSQQINIVLTNAQWHLALLACLVILSSPPRNIAWKGFDVVVLVLSGFTGPFGIVLLPLGVIFWRQRPGKWRPVQLSILLVSALVQIAELRFHPGTPARLEGSLGASPGELARLIGGQVFHGTLLGVSAFASQSSGLRNALAAILGIALILYCAARCRLELRLFFVFSACLLAASLHNPLIIGPLPQWQLLAHVPGNRYWFFPSLSFVWALLWLAFESRPTYLRPIALAFLVVLSHAICTEWSYPRFPDEHFSYYVEVFESAPPGTTVTVPICPPGTTLKLIKK
jgi:hypothetical protein